MLTVKELKKYLESVPDVDDEGNETQVWMYTGDKLTAAVTSVDRLWPNDIVFNCALWDESHLPGN